MHEYEYVFDILDEQRTQKFEWISFFFHIQKLDVTNYPSQKERNEGWRGNAARGREISFSSIIAVKAPRHPSDLCLCQNPIYKCHSRDDFSRNFFMYIISIGDSKTELSQFLDMSSHPRYIEVAFYSKSFRKNHP